MKEGSDRGKEKWREEGIKCTFDPFDKILDPPQSHTVSYAQWRQRSSRIAAGLAFLPHDAMHSADYAVGVARCLSVRPSICHTPVFCQNIDISSNFFTSW